MIHKDVLKLKNIVRKILINNLITRDNDIMLFNLVWEYQNKNLDSLSFKEFMKLLNNKSFFAPESIRRSRQKIQELYPETRGYMYFERHDMQEEMKLILKQYKNYNPTSEDTQGNLFD